MIIRDFPSELLSYLQGEEQRAFDGSLIEQRKIALDFYNGEPFGDEVEGRSQLVTRDVAEVVDYMVSAIMKVVISDKVVEFEARDIGEQPQLPPPPPNADPQMIAQAQQAIRQQIQAVAKAAQSRAEDATELVTWQFMRQQSGYRIVLDCLKAGLLEKTGVFKTWVETPTITVDGQALASDVDADDSIIAAEPIEGAFDTKDGATLEQVYNVRRAMPGKPVYHDEAVPNEEFRFSSEARELDSAGYLCHQTRKMLGDLAKDFGLSPDEMDEVWSGSLDTQQLSDARDSGRSRKDSETVYATGAARMVWLNEEYVRYDWNGDGNVELICVHRVGTKVLSAVEVDEQPFVIWCPFPMQHRIVGQSLADKVMDIQRVRSVILRQAMDALYFANAPRVLIDTQNMDENTIDDILSIVPGAPIRYKGQAPQPWQMNFAAGEAFNALEFMTGERESRTGITRHNQGLNPDTLNKTASGMAMLQDQGAQMEAFVARNFAEALAELFEKKLRLMRRHGAIEPIRVGGEFKTVDASQLDDGMDMAIRVGLGTNNKDKRLAQRQQIIAMQAEAFQNGLSIVDEEKLYNSAAGYVEDTGLGDPNQFFNDPTQNPQPDKPQQPDPAMAKVIADQQYNQAVLQTQHDKNMAEIQLKAADIQMRHQANADNTQVQAAVDKYRADTEAHLDLYRTNVQAAVAMHSNATRAAQIGKNRDGGRLDA